MPEQALFCFLLCFYGSKSQKTLLLQPSNDKKITYRFDAILLPEYFVAASVTMLRHSSLFAPRLPAK